ncbi:MAG: glycosyltransferase 87 family protein [Chloroflexota bacterium]
MEPVSRQKPGWLAATAAASLGLYLCLAVRYPLGPSLEDPRASWASQVDPTWQNAALHLVIYLGLTALYLAALRLLAPAQGGSETPARRPVPLIVIAWLACSGVLLFVAPAGESHDIFDYLFRGRMMVEYQSNPLAEIPDSFSLSTPYSRYLAWRKHVDTYGPIWEASSAAVAKGVHLLAARLGWWDESAAVCPKSPESCRLLIVYITSYRLLAISLTGLAAWLVASIVGRRRTGLVPLALAAWLWNPLTLMATALGGHNDAIMLALALLGWWLLQRQRPLWGVLALILAAHVKLTALIWLPACALWIVWRYGWRQALKIGVASAACALALSWLLYAPFGGWQTLPRMLQERSTFLANSPWEILQELLKETWGWQYWDAHRLATNLPNWLSLAGALLIPLWMFNFRPRRWRSAPATLEEAEHSLWRALAAVSMLCLLAGTFWFQHWYVLWALAPAVLLPEGQLTRAVLPWLALGALASNAAVSFYLSTLPKDAPDIWGATVSVAITWGPVALVATLRALAGRWRKRYRLVPAI